MLRKASGVLGVLVLGLAVAGGGVVLADDVTGVEFQYAGDLDIQLPTVQNGVKKMILFADKTLVLQRPVATTWAWQTTDTSTEFGSSLRADFPQNIQDPNNPNALCCCTQVAEWIGNWSSQYQECFDTVHPYTCQQIVMDCVCGKPTCAPGTTKLIEPGDIY